MVSSTADRDADSKRTLYGSAVGDLSADAQGDSDQPGGSDTVSGGDSEPAAACRILRTDLRGFRVGSRLYRYTWDRLERGHRLRWRTSRFNLYDDYQHTRPSSIPNGTLRGVLLFLHGSGGKLFGNPEVCRDLFYVGRKTHLQCLNQRNPGIDQL